MSAVDKNEERRKKQLILGGTAVALLAVVGGGSMLLMDNNGGEDKQNEKDVKTVELQPVGSIENADNWRRSVGEEEQSRDMQIEELRNQLRNNEQTNADLVNQLNQMNSKIAAIQNQPPQVIKEVRTPVQVNSGYTPTGNYPSFSNGSSGSILPSPTGKSSKKSSKKGQTSSTTDVNTANGANNAISSFNSANPLPAPNGSSVAMGGPQPSRTVEVINFNLTDKKRTTDGNKSLNSLIPTTSFVATTLLNGADAPTGGQAQSNPLPIVLQVRNLANLPNSKKADIKNCRFLGAAWGDLSSERMFARIESLSCVINGKAYEMPAKGYIVGEDGKTGMRGRLVSRKGKTLGLSFLAGVVNATGAAFQSTATTTTSIGGLSSRTINTGDVGRAALGGGISEGANSLGEYYRQQAERLFDVIEVDAGRSPEVLITSAIEFPNGIKLNNGTYQIGGAKRVVTDD